MSSGAGLPFQEAYELARRAAEILSPTVARLKVVGSLRRRRKRVGDIEFVAEPQYDEDLLGGRVPILEPVRAAMCAIGNWVKGGDRMMVVSDILGRPGARLELWVVHPPAQWGSILAIRTGPKDLGTYCVTAMRLRGYRHGGGHVEELATKITIGTPDEETFFNLAGVPHVAPHERDALEQKLRRPA